MEILPNELKYLIFSKINNTKSILAMRCVCKEAYNYFKNVPIFKNKQKIAIIYFKDNEILWKATNDNKPIKRIIFKKYGEVKTILYKPLFFNNLITIESNLPHNFKIDKHCKATKRVTELEIKTQKVTTREIALIPHMCLIS